MVRIVFLGEFDAGKSTLIGRLLFDTGSISEERKEEFLKVSKELGKSQEFAYLLDSFEEERKGEFTLDTTQVFLKTKNREYLLIDVPGHKELIKNMLTGTSYADKAILISDVEKPLEEQTQRHLYLLKFLGIDEFIIVINKMDKVGFDKLSFDKSVKEIEYFLREMDLKPLAIIPISAQEGENLISHSFKMDWYSGPSLLEAIEKFEIKKEKEKPLRFLVQDIYFKKGKEIVLGRVISGKLNLGDDLKIAPEGGNCRVKKIVVFGKRKKEAREKESIGLILDKKGIKRGQILYKDLSPQIGFQFTARIFSLSSFSNLERFIFKSNVQESECSIVKINEVLDPVFLRKKISQEIKSNEVAELILKTEKPIVFESFSNTEEVGKFILYKDGKALAVGIIP